MGDVSQMSNQRPWFTEDITMVIEGVLMVAWNSGGHSSEYLRGFRACALAIATIVGIDPNKILKPPEV